METAWPGCREQFRINDLQPVMLMHPNRPKLEREPLAQLTDPNGRHLFCAFVDMAGKSGVGVVDYLWSKPGFDEPMQPRWHGRPRS